MSTTRLLRGLQLIAAARSPPCVSRNTTFPLKSPHLRVCALLGSSDNRGVPEHPICQQIMAHHPLPSSTTVTGLIPPRTVAHILWNGTFSDSTQFDLRRGFTRSRPAAIPNLAFPIQGYGRRSMSTNPIVRLLRGTENLVKSLKNLVSSSITTSKELSEDVIKESADLVKSVSPVRVNIPLPKQVTDSANYVGKHTKDSAEIVQRRIKDVKNVAFAAGKLVVTLPELEQDEKDNSNEADTVFKAAWGLGKAGFVSSFDVLTELATATKDVSKTAAYATTDVAGHVLGKKVKDVLDVGVAATVTVHDTVLQAKFLNSKDALAKAMFNQVKAGAVDKLKSDVDKELGDRPILIDVAPQKGPSAPPSAPK
eukprot:TRINITY_DN6655_c0_g1_i1.p1 TRINITY_DN6655_c0_g1~~TRINITY_DN6655_c0_g1_i1.p1  ORF type:complete len:367 (-),score=17.02 TRINITY_DN6655_c0_g1_i1:330-1430(-)